MLLLVASYYFYACWRVEYLSLIVISTIIDYVAALRMHKCEELWQRRFWLGCSLTANLGLLFFFKYLNFFGTSFQNSLNFLNIPFDWPGWDILLPVGISFYTFQTLSYTIDVYWRHREPERHLGIFALYVSFFPQLVAGPIERSTHLLPQFRTKHTFDAERFYSGLFLCFWGMFKKLVIADGLAQYVNMVYGNAATSSGLAVLIATYFFAFQIYCDFSGYSDIAIGISRMLGFDLMDNFRSPYFSRSIGEFWHRWHISLSTWFRDYVYIPLGGNRGSKLFAYRNVLIVFLVSGLWHGANWTFVVWGGLHGMFLICGTITKPWRDGLATVVSDRCSTTVRPWFQTARNTIAIFITFHLVVLGWIFFRAENISQAWQLLCRLPLDWGVRLGDPFEILKGFAVIGFLWTVELIEQKYNLYHLLNRCPLPIRWSWYYGVAILIILFGVFGGSQFIYFQF